MKELLFMGSLMMIFVFIIYYLAMAGGCQQFHKQDGTFVFEETLNQCLKPSQWVEDINSK